MTMVGADFRNMKRSSFLHVLRHVRDIERVGSLR